MATTASHADQSAALGNFLLSSFIETWLDPSRTRADSERMLLRFEAFLLSSGPEILDHLTSSFNVNDVTLLANPLVSSWFITFVSSLDATWLKRVDISTVRRFWVISRESRLRRSAIELIAKVEWNDEYKVGQPYLSALVQMFGQVQSGTALTGLSQDSKSIIDAIFTRAILTDPRLLDFGSSLGNYMLRVLRYCFVQQGDVLSEETLSWILSLASGLTNEQRSRIGFQIRSAQ